MFGRPDPTQFAEQWLGIFDEIFRTTDIANEVFHYPSEEELCSILDRIAASPDRGGLLTGSGFLYYRQALDAWAEVMGDLDQLMRDHPGRWTDTFEPWWPEFILYQMLKKRLGFDQAGRRKGQRR